MKLAIQAILFLLIIFHVHAQQSQEVTAKSGLRYTILKQGSAVNCSACFK